VGLTVSRTLVIAIAGIALGLALGWAIFSGPSSGAQPERPGTTAVTKIPHEAHPSMETVVLERSSPTGQQSPAESTASVETGPRGLREALLEARVRDLESQLKQEKSKAEAITGKPLSPPSNLPDRFKQEELRKAVTAAFQHVSPQAEVTSVDCTEYPCIVYGAGMLGHQSQEINGVPGLEPYVADFRIVTINDDGFFAFCAAPSDDPNDANDLKIRFTARMTQMAIATSAK
jgi:hypothetical protein